MFTCAPHSKRNVTQRGCSLMTACSSGGQLSPPKPSSSRGSSRSSLAMRTMSSSLHEQLKCTDTNLFSTLRTATRASRNNSASASSSSIFFSGKSQVNLHVFGFAVECFPLLEWVFVAWLRLLRRLEGYMPDGEGAGCEHAVQQAKNIGCAPRLIPRSDAVASELSRYLPRDRLTCLLTPYSN